MAKERLRAQPAIHGHAEHGAPQHYQLAAVVPTFARS
jgi:hypothetical protein